MSYTALINVLFVHLPSLVLTTHLTTRLIREKWYMSNRDLRARGDGKGQNLATFPQQPRKSLAENDNYIPEK